MGKLIKLVRAALSQLTRYVWKAVRIGGRIVLQLLPNSEPAPMPPIEEAVPELQAHEPLTNALAGERFRDLAEAIRDGAVQPRHLGGFDDAEVQWLLSLEPAELDLLLAHSDREIRQHITGGRTIRGLLRPGEPRVEEMTPAEQQDLVDRFWLTSEPWP